MPMPALKEARERKAAVDKSLADVFAAATDSNGELDLKRVSTTDMPSGIKSSHDLRDWIIAENDKSSALADDIKKLSAIEDAATKRRNGREDEGGSEGGTK